MELFNQEPCHIKEQMQIPQAPSIKEGGEDTASLRRHVKSLREELLYTMDMYQIEMTGKRKELRRKDQAMGELTQKISILEGQVGVSQAQMKKLKGELEHEKQRNLIGGWLLKGVTDSMKRSYAKQNHLAIDQLQWKLVTTSDGHSELQLRKFLEASETDGGEARNESSTSSGTGHDDDGALIPTNLNRPVPVGDTKLPHQPSSSEVTDLSNDDSTSSSASSLVRPVLIQLRKRKRSGNPKSGPSSADLTGSPLALRQHGFLQPGSGRRRCLCGEPFENMKLLRLHIARKRRDIAGHCLICDRAFWSQRELKEHRCKRITGRARAQAPAGSRAPVPDVPQNDTFICGEPGCLCA